MFSIMITFLVIYVQSKRITFVLAPFEKPHYIWEIQTDLNKLKVKVLFHDCCHNVQELCFWANDQYLLMIVWKDLVLGQYTLFNWNVLSTESNHVRLITIRNPVLSVWSF